MQFYFDESGDTGDTKKSISKFFVIAVYMQGTKEEGALLENKLRSELQINSKTILKWNKADKKRKEIFEKIFLKYLINKTFIIYCNKSEIENISFEIYQEMITRLILDFNLYGKYKYDGDHLNKVMERVRKDFKSKGKKVFFQNTETSNNFGIQLADMCAGFIHHLRDLQQEVNFKNVIKFKT